MGGPCIVTVGGEIRWGITPSASTWETGWRVRVWSKVENDRRWDELIAMWQTQLEARREGR
jgi:hypothetical protein